MGGVWERQIRTIRAILMGLVDQQPPDDDGLLTLVCLVESIVNSRPITRLSSDPNDLAPLTPNHLLHQKGAPLLSPGVFVERDCYRKRWKHIQYLADVFWKRWE